MSHKVALMQIIQYNVDHLYLCGSKPILFAVSCPNKVSYSLVYCRFYFREHLFSHPLELISGPTQLIVEKQHLLR